MHENRSPAPEHRSTAHLASISLRDLLLTRFRPLSPVHCLRYIAGRSEHLQDEVRSHYLRVAATKSHVGQLKIMVWRNFTVAEIVQHVCTF